MFINVEMTIKFHIATCFDIRSQWNRNKKRTGDSMRDDIDDEW